MGGSDAFLVLESFRPAACVREPRRVTPVRRKQTQKDAGRALLPPTNVLFHNSYRKRTPPPLKKKKKWFPKCFLTCFCDYAASFHTQRSV